MRVNVTASISDTENTEIGMLSNVSFEEQSGEPSVSQTVSVTPTQRPPTTGLDRPVLHGISLSEHSQTTSSKILPSS
jgi:hypothetical protein